jgi:3-oxoacyl-[acyl-carrier protein] reductase
MEPAANPRSVSGRVAVVTGAASGMGRAIAELFANEGARVAALDRADTVPYVVDVADRNAVHDAVARVRADLGPIDVLVNCAGVSIPAPVDGDGYDDAWRTTLAVNLDGYVHLIRACLADLERNRDGRIVNIASTEGLGATAMISPYTVSKHGVVGLTRALAVELGPRGVTVNCICPGPIHTGMTEWIPDDAKTKFARRRVPLRRYGAPEEVADVVLSLALPSASFITGAVVPVDGGLTAMNG